MDAEKEQKKNVLFENRTTQEKKNNKQGAGLVTNKNLSTNRLNPWGSLALMKVTFPQNSPNR